MYIHSFAFSTSYHRGILPGLPDGIFAYQAPNFGMLFKNPWHGQLWYILRSIGILRPFAVVYSHWLYFVVILVIFSPFWYVLR
jgi:hypothetical protein